jgi:crossover junction endodeoxyribonuclease RuvC
MDKVDNYFIGIDLSYSNTGLIILDQNVNIIEEKSIKTNNKKTYEERIIDIYKECEFVNNILHLQMISIEGLSFGSTGKLAELGALHYYFRIELFKNKTPYQIITPTELKKFITGKGNCKKDIMIKEIYKKWGVDYNDNNLADAYSLAQYSLTIQKEK